MANPGDPSDDSEADVFELAAPVVPVKPVRRKQTVMPAAAPFIPNPMLGPSGVAPVLNYAHTAPAEAIRAVAADPEFASPARDIWVPASLLIVAFGVLLAAAYREEHLLTALLAIGAFAVTKAVVMAVAVPAMTRFADVSFGRIAPSLLKLAAIGLLPDAAAVSVVRWADACSGVLLSIPAAVITGWLLLRFLFDFDFAEAMWCTVVLTVITLVPYMLWYQLYWKVLDVAG